MEQNKDKTLTILVNGVEIEFIEPINLIGKLSDYRYSCIDPDGVVYIMQHAAWPLEADDEEWHLHGMYQEVADVNFTEDEMTAEVWKETLGNLIYK